MDWKQLALVSADFEQIRGPQRFQVAEPFETMPLSQFSTYSDNHFSVPY